MSSDTRVKMIRPTPNVKLATQRIVVDGLVKTWYACLIHPVKAVLMCQKQERRARARGVIDPSHPDWVIPQETIRFDYQSSEYSSPGPDSSEEEGETKAEAKVRRGIKEGKRREIWDSMRQPLANTSGNGSSENEKPGGQYGWAPGLGSKVLEVRTPSWRSEKVRPRILLS
jgi:hypothetical protein